MSTRAFAAQSATSPLAPFSFERRTPRDTDVAIDILYCGVCHSDLHQARSEWFASLYPCVPGHEVVGRVTAVGSKVRKFKEGDLAAVGCMVDSCRSCDSCAKGLEQYCDHSPTWTYNSEDKIGVAGKTGMPTYGGYSERIVVDQAFTLHVPKSLDLAATAPLLCAGITTYSPLRHWGVKKGQTVGVVGLGGLGHMGVKFARSFGAHVVVFTTSPGKADDAKHLGAHDVVITKDTDWAARNQRKFDFILDTVSAQHDLNAYLSCLKLDGTLALVGVPAQPLPVSPFSVIMPRRQFAGSGIGGIAETQEMLDYCAQHNIVSDIETIRIHDINAAWDRMEKGDVKYRFVIDMASLKK